MTRFTFATLVPVLLLFAAGFFGGFWVWGALAYITCLVAGLDQVKSMAAPADPGVEFPAGTGLSVVLALVHFPLLALAVHVVSGMGPASGAERFGAFLGFGLFFGQVSNSNAHELIHRGNRHLRTLGKAVYVSVLYGHHASAHPLVHHVHVATPDDPNSPQGRISYYRFALRALRGEYAAGKAAETARRKRAKKTGMHPYTQYALGSVATGLVAAGIGGIAGILTLGAIALHVQSQHLLSDYVQHYGLFRRRDANGKLEPCGPQHSWNAPHWLSSAMMLNAPRHSDHHMRPGVAYPGLVLSQDTMPTLPYPLPVMALIALWPGQWRRVMDPRVAKWQNPAG